MDGEIINADSMQMYMGLENITNKHPREKRMGVPHHLLGHVPWLEEYFIHRFSQEANSKIQDIVSRGKVPIVVGGTHYYLQSLLFRNKTIVDTDQLSSSKRSLSPEELHLLDGPVANILQYLQNVDPVIAGKFHPQDYRKLRRALEIYFTTGRKALQVYRDQKTKEYEDSSLRFNTIVIWLYARPETLNDRLDSRVDQMMLNGAVEEIRSMYHEYLALDPRPDCTRGIWQVIGYKEFLPWLKGSVGSPGIALNDAYKEGVDRMKIHTRQYAKSQVKWIRKLLAVELQKEARFKYKYGGKLYLLDASDLTRWKENVSDYGIAIAKQFLQSGSTSVTHAQYPPELSSVYPSEKYVVNLTSNKRAGAELEWRHITCDICKDKNGIPIVAIGETNWDAHVHSRRHKRRLKYLERNVKLIEHWETMKGKPLDELYQ